MNINHERLVPGAITYWGDVVGDITDQTDLVEYVASHGGGGGGGDAIWGSIQGTLSNQTDLNDRLTEINDLAQEAYNLAKYTSNSLDDHAEQNDFAFKEAFDRIDALEQGGGGGGVTPEEFNDHKAQNDVAFKEAFDRIDALEQGVGGGVVTPEEFKDHKAQNDAAFKEAFDRIDALEQGGGGGGVTPEEFNDHKAQNAADFQAINDQFQNYATRDYANQLYQSSIDNINQSVSVLGESIDELRNDLSNNTVTTQQCEDPGLTDYILTSLVWNGSPAILAMDDYYTGDNAENRDVTIWGSYIENDRFKFGKVKTTYEQDPNTQEYTVTGQTFSEMIAAEAPDTSTDATYVLKATVLNGQVTYSWVPENAS